MMRAIGQRPERTGGIGILRIAAQQPGADAEQDPPAQLEGLRLGFIPWEWLQQWQPRILKLRQGRAGHSPRQQVPRDCLQSRLGRRIFPVAQLLEPLAPPGKPDGTEVGIGAARNDIGERKVEAPQRLKGGANSRGKLLKRDLAVGIELSLSDR